MIIVPLNGDTIETAAGVPRRVISYSNLNSSGPVVRVRSTGTDLETVPFKEILRLNDLDVELLKNAHGQNVMSTDGYLKRELHLPQPGEEIQANTGIEARWYIVNRVRLHVKGRLSEGMILECTDEDDGTETDVRLHQIDDIHSVIFNSKKFLKLYADYVGTRTNEVAK